MVMREEEDSDDSIEGDFDGIDDPKPETKVGFASKLFGIWLTRIGNQYHEQEYY
jgi:hypothetical protein